MDIWVVKLRLRSIAIACLFIGVLGTLVTSYVWFTSTSPQATNQPAHTPECNTQLSAEIGAPSSLCLQWIQIATSRTNSSQVSIPIMIMRPGTATVLDILYLLAAASEGHIGPLPNVTASEDPVVISVPSGTRGTSLVSMSNASIIFQNARLVIYRYTLSASANSDGYYAILPPYYYGIYPALVIGSDPAHLNPTSLSLWAYNGVVESAEFAIPSFIVGTGDLNVVNVTLPIIEDCLNPACVMVSHSQS